MRIEQVRYPYKTTDILKYKEIRLKNLSPLKDSKDKKIYNSLTKQTNLSTSLNIY